MPPVPDLRQALDLEAYPKLQAIADNEDVRTRSLRRFERDHPPRYVSSSTSPDPEEIILSVLPPRRRPVPEELQAIMDPPLTEHEIQMAAFHLSNVLLPEEIYYRDLKREQNRVERQVRKPRPMMFQRRIGSRRIGLIVRHGVKRRWEKLGIWNPRWGFAGRRVEPADDYNAWKWRWQSDSPGVSKNKNERSRAAAELLRRTLRRRQHLQRGEQAPRPRYSHLAPDCTAEEAEAFLTSRPWFLFMLEVAAEDARYQRLSWRDHQLYFHNAELQVFRRWKRQGCLKPGCKRISEALSWKWANESPSPEPEDISHIKDMKESPLEVAEEMDFTPSEIDDLEMMELPEEQQPKNYYLIFRDEEPKHCFPGQVLELSKGKGDGPRHLRRSARIAGVKRRAEISTEYITPQPKRPRRKTESKKNTAPVSGQSKETSSKQAVQAEQPKPSAEATSGRLRKACTKRKADVEPTTNNELPNTRKRRATGEERPKTRRQQAAEDKPPKPRTRQAANGSPPKTRNRRATAA
ncbi:hypothetical protein F4780DRAFT_88171 [Xylariomycetidae sp. FL0641]|nr:hypothetical protein F4780DRAFT_88171 [Xylariomycetidae sp. FL0641]